VSPKCNHVFLSSGLLFKYNHLNRLIGEVNNYFHLFFIAALCIWIWCDYGNLSTQWVGMDRLIDIGGDIDGEAPPSTLTYKVSGTIIKMAAAAPTYKRTQQTPWRSAREGPGRGLRPY